MPSSSSKSLPTVAGILAVLFWSATVAVAREIVERLGPLTASAALYLAGGVLSSFPLLIRPERIGRILRLPRAYLFGCGGLVVLYVLCFFLALGLAADRAQVVEIGLINYLWPALTLMLAMPILGHRARIGLVPGVLIALAGIGLVAAAQSEVLSWSGFLADLRSNAAPYLLALAGALAWALYSNLSRRWAADAGGGAMNLFMLASGLVLLLARCFFREHPHWTRTSPSKWLSTSSSRSAWPIRSGTSPCAAAGWSSSPPSRTCCRSSRPSSSRCTCASR